MTNSNGVDGKKKLLLMFVLKLKCVYLDGSNPAYLICCHTSARCVHAGPRKGRKGNTYNVHERTPAFHKFVVYRKSFTGDGELLEVPVDTKLEVLLFNS